MILKIRSLYNANENEFDRDNLLHTSCNVFARCSLISETRRVPRGADAIISCNSFFRDWIRANLAILIRTMLL